VVFPIRGGSHVVSEALAKALVNRGYVVLRLERRRVFRDDDRPGDFTTPAGRLRDSLLDARRLIGWLETHPEVDRERLATAGVSLGGILAATLMGVDERIQAGLFIMAGGGLPELLHDSGDGRLRRFRERALERAQDRSREAFVAALEPHTRLVDPLSYANRIDPRRALLVSGRFDRVVPPQSTETLWEAMGRPTWLRFPTGHYQFVPFFWWAVERGSQFFGRVFSDLPGPQQAAEAMELVPAAGP
jgi:dipeptidyl aminopeptidase/acylaminoacyl peptidase